MKTKDKKQIVNILIILVLLVIIFLVMYRKISSNYVAIQLTSISYNYFYIYNASPINNFYYMPFPIKSPPTPNYTYFPKFNSLFPRNNYFTNQINSLSDFTDLTDYPDTKYIHYIKPKSYVLFASVNINLYSSNTTPVPYVLCDTLQSYFTQYDNYIYNTTATVNGKQFSKGQYFPTQWGNITETSSSTNGLGLPDPGKNYNLIKTANPSAMESLTASNFFTPTGLVRPIQIAANIPTLLSGYDVIPGQFNKVEYSAGKLWTPSNSTGTGKWSSTEVSGNYQYILTNVGSSTYGEVSIPTAQVPSGLCSWVPVPISKSILSDKYGGILIVYDVDYVCNNSGKEVPLLRANNTNTDDVVSTTNVTPILLKNGRNCILPQWTGIKVPALSDYPRSTIPLVNNNYIANNYTTIEQPPSSTTGVVSNRVVTPSITTTFTAISSPELPGF